MSQKRSLVDGFLYFLNVVFAIALLLSYLAYYIPPTLITAFSFIATGYPILAIINILFVVYWAIRLKRKILLPLVCLAVGYLHLPRMYQFGKAQRVVPKEESLKVMNFNIRLFNLYQWLDDPDVKQDISALIRQEDPDVVMLQEYLEGEENPLKELNYPYRHSKLTNEGKSYGLMILSKYPITGSAVIPVEEDTARQSEFHYADIRWKGQNIRFVNVHLASVRLDHQEYDLLENPDRKNQDDLKRGIKTITTNLHHAFRLRTIQTKALLDIIRDSPFPVVLAGDFNDVPHSYIYHQIDLELQDSFMSGGHGFGKTYVRSPVPFRIDYIFHSKMLQSFNFRVIKKEYSDHYPIVTELQFR